MNPTPNLTPWFTKGEKPAHIGVYNVSCRKEGQTGWWYSYWDGSYFRMFSTDVDVAYDHSGSSWGHYTNEEGSWRGLAENAEV